MILSSKQFQALNWQIIMILREKERFLKSQEGKIVACMTSINLVFFYLSP